MNRGDGRRPHHRPRRLAPAEPERLTMGAQLRSIRGIDDFEGLSIAAKAILPIVASACQGDSRLVCVLMVSMADLAMDAAGAPPASIIRELQANVDALRAGYVAQGLLPALPGDKTEDPS